MIYRIIQRTPNRFHLDLMQRRLSETEADALYYSLIDLPGIENVKVYQRSAQLTVRYVGVESAILDYISDMDLSDPTLLDNVPTVSARATNEMYKNKILDKVMLRVGKWLFLPLPVRTAVTIYQAVPFVWRGLKDLFQKNMSAEIIHAAAVLARLPGPVFARGRLPPILLTFRRMLFILIEKRSGGWLSCGITKSKTHWKRSACCGRFGLRTPMRLRLSATASRSTGTR